MKLAVVVLAVCLAGCDTVVDAWNQHDAEMNARRQAYLEARFTTHTVVKVGDCTQRRCAVKLDNGEVIRVLAPAMVGMEVRRRNPGM